MQRESNGVPNKDQQHSRITVRDLGPTYPVHKLWLDRLYAEIISHLLIPVNLRISWELEICSPKSENSIRVAEHLQP